MVLCGILLVASSSPCLVLSCRHALADTGCCSVLSCSLSSVSLLFLGSSLPEISGVKAIALSIWWYRVSPVLHDLVIFSCAVDQFTLLSGAIGEVLSRVEAVGTVLIHGVSVIRIVFSRAMSPLVQSFVARFSVTQVARLSCPCVVCYFFHLWVLCQRISRACGFLPLFVRVVCFLVISLPPSSSDFLAVISGPMYLSCH